jgi:DNA repair protein RadC
MLGKTLGEGAIQYPLDFEQGQEDHFLAEARAIARRRVVRMTGAVDSPQGVRRMLGATLLGYPFEVFGCLFLDARHQGIAFEEIARGSLTGAAVYVGEVARAALRLNAAAVLCVHNHPSGVVEPSSADRELTERLRQGLALIEVRLLDHIIASDASGEVCSFAERGWL